MASAAAFKTDVLADEVRSSRRHILWLSARVSVRGEAEQVLIHNMSTSGLLFEATLALTLGDRIEIDLPEAGTISAEIVWCSDSYYGCEFASPILPAAVSASRLRSPSPRPAAEFRDQTAAPEYVPLAAAVPGALSPLQKTAIIVGAATACWVPIIAAVAYF
jgi:hypothetical protein